MIDTYAIDAGGPYDVVVRGVLHCRRVTVQEQYDSVTPPTTDLRQYMPKGNADVAFIAKGTPAVFSAPTGGSFYPGQTIGQIQTVTGSITVQQQEGDAV